MTAQTEMEIESGEIDEMPRPNLGHDSDDSGSGFQSENEDEYDSDKELQAAFAKGLLKSGRLNYAAKPKRPLVNNVSGLKSALQRLKRDDLGWDERLDVTLHHSSLRNGDGPENELAAESSNTHFANLQDDDFKRELLFYRQAQEAVRIAIPKLHKLGIPTRRPDDYYAEMAKSDGHMTKVRQKLVDIQSAKKKYEASRRLREEKKYATKVQKERMVQQISEKRKLNEAVKKSRKGMTEQLDDILNNRKAKADDKAGGKKSSNKQVGGPKVNKKRAFKDSKFGFGGRKKGTKGNTAESFGNVFNNRIKRSSSAGNKIKKASGGGKKRLGKSRRKAGK